MRSPRDCDGDVVRAERVPREREQPLKEAYEKGQVCGFALGIALGLVICLFVASISISVNNDVSHQLYELRMQVGSGV